MKPQESPTATNKSRFACFACRKAFKQPESSDWNPDIPQRPFHCPDCKQPMTRLGRYFKAPPQRAARQWLKIELLVEFGERFERGDSGLDKSCETLAETIRYLIDRGHDETDVRRTLEQIRRKRRKRADSAATRTPARSPRRRPPP